jgi:hypothetical protein
VPRFDLREHGKLFDSIKIVSNPIDQLMTKAAKLFTTHISEARVRGRLNRL